MESKKLEKYKKQFKDISNQIGYLQNYLSTKQLQRDAVILPHAISKALQISEFDAIFLLSLAEKEDLIHRKFLVFTRHGHHPLGEFNSSAEIPKFIEDEETGREINSDNFYVDIVFQVA